MYWLYIVKSSGKLLHFINIFSIDETALLSINQDDQYLAGNYQHLDDRS